MNDLEIVRQMRKQLEVAVRKLNEREQELEMFKPTFRNVKRTSERGVDRVQETVSYVINNINGELVKTGIMISFVQLADTEDHVDENGCHKRAEITCAYF